MANAISLSDVIGPVGKIKMSIEHIDTSVTDITKLLYGIGNTIVSSIEQNKEAEAKQSSPTVSEVFNKTDKVKDEKLAVLNEIDFKFGELLDLITGKSTKLKKDTGGSGGNSKLKGYSASIKEIASAVSELGLLGPVKALLFSATVSILEGPIQKMFKLFDDCDVDADEVADKSKALDITAGAILKFCASMSLTALLAIPAALGALAAIPLVMLSVKLMNIVGEAKDGAKEGAETLGILSISLLGFTASLALTGLIVGSMIGSGNVTVESVLGTLGVFVLIGATMYLYTMIDLAGDCALEGALTVGALGLSLLAFTGGFVLSNMIVGSFIKSDDFSIGSLITTVGVFALAFGTLWVFNKFASEDGENALKGALVIGALGVSLLVFTGCFALSAMIMSSFIESDDFSIGSLLATVGVFALAIAAQHCLSSIGEDWKDILKGVGAVAAMGIGLLIFGYGFGKAAEYIQPIAWEDLGKLAVVIGGLQLEFGLAGMAAAPIALGAAAMAGVGISLYSIGNGINEFNQAVGDEESLEKLLGPRNATTGAYDTSKGLMLALVNSVFGIFAQDDVLKKLRGSRKGLKAAKKLNEVLCGLANGIGTFANLESKGIPDGWDENGNPISYRPFDLIATSDAIIKLLNTLPNVFGTIGDNVGEKGGFSLFGKTTSVEKGIDAVKGIGFVLSSLALGVASFGLIYSKGIPIFNKDGSQILEWVPFNQDALIEGLTGKDDQHPGILTALSSAFATVGSSGTEVKIPNGISGVGGTSVRVSGNANNVLNGIMSAAGMSTVLVNIATAVNSFANLETMKDTNGKKIDISSVTANINAVLTAIPNGFNAIKWDDLKKANSRAEYFEDDSPLTLALKNISSVIPNFTKTIDAQNIKTLTESVVSVGTALSTVPEKKGDGTTYGEMILNQMPKLTDFATKGSDKLAEMIEKTKKSINDIDLDKVNGLAGMYKAMAELAKMKKNDFDTLSKRITEAAEKIVEAVLEASGSANKQEKLPSQPQKPQQQQPPQTTVAQTKQPPQTQTTQTQEVRIYLNDIEGFGNGFTVIPR